MKLAINVATGALLLAATASSVLAAPLDKETCASLKAEHAALVSSGAREDMRKGPAWAKDNLAPDRLKQIERFIEVGEQLGFRCGSPEALALRGAGGEDGETPRRRAAEPVDEKPGAKAAEPAATPAKPAKPARKAQAAKAKAPAAKAGKSEDDDE